MRIVWSDSALDDLADIRRSIAALNPHAAARVAHSIRQTVEKLKDFPCCGRQGEDGTRELVVVDYPSYLLIYDTATTGDDPAIIILTVWKNWLPR